MAFQSLVITIDVNGVRYSASLHNGLLTKAWDEADEADWSTNG